MSDRDLTFLFGTEIRYPNWIEDETNTTRTKFPSGKKKMTVEIKILTLFQQIAQNIHFLGLKDRQ